MLANGDTLDGCAGLEDVSCFSEWIDFDNRLKRNTAMAMSRPMCFSPCAEATCASSALPTSDIRFRNFCYGSAEA